jgi:NNP family nitrate/nitrite transporter-like MFS transporter
MVETVEQQKDVVIPPATTENVAEQPEEMHSRNRILTLSTSAFTLMFAVWLMFGVLGIPIRKEFGLSDIELGWLAAVAILNGSLWRLAFGILTDKIGGRKVMTVLLLLTAIPTFLVTTASSFTELMIYAFLLGLAGNAFSVGISWNSAWFPKKRQGFALGVFGSGNVGASVTKLIGPALITLVPVGGLLGGVIPGGWRFVPVLYTGLLIVMAALVWFFAPAHDHKPGAGRSLGELLRPLKFIRVWRFSLYYVVVFGAYVALASWLPKYYVDVYGFELKDAALLTALFIFPASLLRPLGGWFSDRFGARRVMYWVFGVMTLTLLLLAAPSGHLVLYVSEKFAADRTRELMQFQLGPVLFTILIFLLGVGMGIGKAAVYKHIPEYFPNDVGAVGGLVGLIGALGGFFLPPLFAYSYNLLGVPQTTFFILLVITGVSFIWMHRTVVRMLNSATPHLRNRFDRHTEAAAH